ncbi:hypothetical protein [Burkholderia lata]|uniref:hypothetical protein n=1 Tax=Burkholderia lata (strain ATCC 17760 / DSM 23089 / LMG 22485 / NCIMB 9086 / R18194 / 383) TaxID=482957 RepID=UPI00399B654F
MRFRQTTMRAGLALTFGIVVALALLVSVVATGDVHVSSASLRARTALMRRVCATAIRRANAVRDLVRVMKPDDVEVERVAMTRVYGDPEARPSRLNRAIASNLDVTDKTRSLMTEINRIEARDSLVALSIADAALQDRREQAIERLPVPLAAGRVSRPNQCLCRSMREASQLARAGETDATRLFNCPLHSRSGCMDGPATTQ